MSKPKQQRWDLSPEERTKLSELEEDTDYQRYVKEHRRRMRQLKRAASGENMESPE